MTIKTITAYEALDGTLHRSLAEVDAHNAAIAQEELSELLMGDCIDWRNEAFDNDQFLSNFDKIAEYVKIIKNGA